MNTAARQLGAVLLLFSAVQHMKIIIRKQARAGLLFLQNKILFAKYSECMKNFKIYVLIWGYAVAQLVEALRYKSECRGFPMVSLEFFIDITLSAALWPWG
jgi:hypothetical protein